MKIEPGAMDKVDYMHGRFKNICSLLKKPRVKQILNYLILDFRSGNEAGKTAKEILAATKMSPQSLKNWLNRMASAGLLSQDTNWPSRYSVSKFITDLLEAVKT